MKKIGEVGPNQLWCGGEGCGAKHGSLFSTSQRKLPAGSRRCMMCVSKAAKAARRRNGRITGDNHGSAWRGASNGRLFAREGMR